MDSTLFLRQFEQERRKANHDHCTTYDCDCANAGMLSGYRARTLKNGTVRIVKQCLKCGRSVGNAVSRAVAGDCVEAFDEDLAERIEAARTRSSIALQERFSRQAWLDAYSKYLESQAWAEKRKLVLKRANGMCEGCGIAAPEEVHHHTYKNVGNEFLFELSALCGSCHKRIHESS